MLKAVLVALVTVFVAILVATLVSPSRPQGNRQRTVVVEEATRPSHSDQYSLDGLNARVIWDTALWYQAVRAAERAEAAEVARRGRTSLRSTVVVTGDCATMKPSGFPDSIIARESGGNPQARNASGAYGCAQIMPEHFSAGGGCAGMDYQSCWNHLWAGGQGASNWACTRESGCG